MLAGKHAGTYEHGSTGLATAHRGCALEVNGCFPASWTTGSNDFVGHRTFTDSNGVLWNAWEVIPQWADRRTGKSRRVRSADDDLDPPVLEQRKRPDRRQ